MKLLPAALALATALVAGQAAAQTTTYTFTSPTYDDTGISNASACVVGECTTYDNTQRVVVTLTFAAPLAAGLTLGDVSGDVVAFSVDDGVIAVSGPSAGTSLAGAAIGTDGAGLPNNFSIGVQRTPGDPLYPFGDENDPDSRFSTIIVIPAQTQSAANFVCEERGSTWPASGPGNCAVGVSDGQSSFAMSIGPVVVTSDAVLAPTPVPTLSEGAMILFGIVLAGGAALMIQRRRLTA